MASATQNTSNPSLVIPWVFSNVSRGRVWAIFSKLELGELDRIDMVHKTNAAGKKYNKVFIHFKHWNDDDEDAQAAKEQVLAGNQIKIVYDEPWYWKVSMSNVPKTERKQGRSAPKKPRTAPRIAGYVEASEKPAAKAKSESSELAEMRALMAEQAKRIEELTAKLAAKPSKKSKSKKNKTKLKVATPAPAEDEADMSTPPPTSPVAVAED
jgi:hypothetical protein